MLKSLYKFRFELFFFSVISIIFGSLFFPKDVFANVISPLLFLINIVSGLLFFLKKNKQIILLSIIFFIALEVFLFIFLGIKDDHPIRYVRFVAYFTFYVLVTIQIIHQVWSAKTVNRSVIFGLMSGYISLGLLGFFTFFCIELAAPGSFNGIAANLAIPAKIESMLYFSYITLLTIGYGDITPLTGIAQKATVFYGMLGQFYLVIITAVVIEKYIRHNHKS